MLDQWSAGCKSQIQALNQPGRVMSFQLIKNCKGLKLGRLLPIVKQQIANAHVETGDDPQRAHLSEPRGRGIEGEERRGR